jgi:hypothetical protein
MIPDIALTILLAALTLGMVLEAAALYLHLVEHDWRRR